MNLKEAKDFILGKVDKRLDPFRVLDRINKFFYRHSYWYWRLTHWPDPDKSLPLLCRMGLHKWKDINISESITFWVCKKCGTYW